MGEQKPKTETPNENENTKRNFGQIIKKGFVKQIIICVVVLAVLAAAVNLGIPALNTKQVFDAMDLPSGLVGKEEPRSVNNSEKRGALTYGPYVTLVSGEYTIRVYYETDTEKNSVDVFSLNVGRKLYLNTLSKTEKFHEFNLKLEETTANIEVRVTYSGEGKLSVEKIEIIPVRKDLQAAQSALNVLLIALFFGYCGYYLPKIKKSDATESGRLTWKDRLKKALPVALFISFTFCLAGPISLYTANTEEFWFSLWQMLPIITLAFAVLTVAVTMVLSLVPGKGFLWILAAIFGLGVALYIEGNFLVQDYGLLNGNAIEWNAFSEWAVIDTLIWIAIPIAILLLAFFLKKWTEKLIQYGSVFLVAVQAVALVIGVATAKDLDKSSEYLLTTKNYNIVSEDENIIVFLLDAFDTKYMDSLLESYPEYKETLTDFVWYKDTATAAAPTHVALPIILTGYRYTDPVSYKDYIKKAFDYTPLYAQLTEHNYDIGVYTSSRYVSGEQEKYISNIYNEKPTINSQSQFLLDMLNLAGFRYMPHILKGQFVIYSGEFDELKSSNEQGEKSYSVNSSESYTMLQQPLTLESGSNAFRFYHLMGPHGPWCLNEKAEVVANEDTTMEKQIRGSFLIIENYMNQMREKGIYDNSTIIIMADHGNIDRQQNPLLMIKAKNSQGDFGISTAQISYMDLLPTFLEILGEDGSKYGRSIFDIGETEQRERYFYRDMQGEVQHGTGARMLIEQMTTDVAWNYDAWVETGKIYYGDADPEKRQKYVFGTELSFLEEATGNQYVIDGLIRIDEVFSGTAGDHTVLEIPLKRKPKTDILVSMTVHSVIGAGKENQLIVYANGTEVFNNENTNGTIEFTIPKDLVKDSITLRFEYPDVPSSGYAFNFVDLKMDA